jgi:cytochrome c553
VSSALVIAATVCAACHGPSGTSVSDSIPNLAGQRAAYLEAQLKFFKDGTRREPGSISRAAIMNAVAAQLDPAEIKDLSAYFSSLPGAADGAKSELLANLVETRATFPQDYKSAYKQYARLEFPERKQVRYYYANDIALNAARLGQSLPDGSVLFVEVFSGEKLTGYTEMARNSGRGSAFPDMLRYENWNYALFTADGKLRRDANQAECLACHKPLDNQSYVFTLKQLTEAARR